MKTRNVVLGLSSLAAAFAIVATCFVVAHAVEAQNRASGPPPGRLIDIGGRRLHLQCSGPTNARPTVVLIPGGGAYSTAWLPVQRNLAQFKTCAYDPAGLGWSDASTVARTLRQDAFDLQLLLDRANVPRPYVLVGHSVGGSVARIYTQHYPGDVAAIVLVDALHEDSTQFNTTVNRWVRVRELSTGRTVPLPAVGSAASANPADDFLPEELQLLHDVRVATPTTLGDLPLFVLNAGKRDQPPGTSAQFWTELKAEREVQAADLVRLSRRGSLIRAEQSGHNIHNDEPALVARAISDAIVAASKVADARK
jgi:pimeloyl-ACP methyl ester carboxylesterase